MEDLETKYSEEVLELKELGEKLNFTHQNFKDDEVVYFLNLFTNEICYDEYQYAKMHVGKVFKEYQDVKNYKEFWIKLSDLVNKAMIDNFQKTIDNFADISSIAPREDFKPNKDKTLLEGYYERLKSKIRLY